MSSRKPQKAVHSTDPSQSGWWLLAPAGGIAAGAAIPYFATHNTAWTTGGGVIGAAVGAAAAATPQFRDWVSARSHRQQIAESTGAATNITGEPLEALRVHRSDHNIAEFIHRDIEDQLVEHLHNGTPALIVGPSMAGKTRLVVETVRAEWPSKPIWFPRNEDDIEVLLNNNLEPTSETVIILDDIDRFLSNQSLTLGTLNRWINNNCIIVGTMARSAYTERHHKEFEQLTGWDVVNRFQILHLSTLLSQNEFHRIGTTSYSRIASEVKEIGLGPSLSCAQDVRNALTEEHTSHSQCSALIKVATDWKRVGLGPASRTQLTTLAEAVYYNDTSHLDWGEAWRKATTPINSVVPFINRATNDKWEVLDFIAESDAGRPVSPDCLYAISTLELNAPQTLMAAIAMFRKGGLNTQIEKMYTRAILNNPDNIKLLGNYVKFLDNIQRKASYFHDISIAQSNLTLFSPQLSTDLPDTQIDIFSEEITNYCSNLEEFSAYEIRSIELNAMQNAEYTIHSRNKQNRLPLAPIQAFLKTLRIKWLSKGHKLWTTSSRSRRRHRDVTPQLADIFNSLHGYLYNTYLYDTHHTKDIYDYILSLHPNNADILGNYAAFLDSMLNDADSADKIYRLALDINPTDIQTICNYASFLYNTKNDYVYVDQLYKQAIKIDPNSTHVTHEYSTFLQNLKSKHN